MRVIVFGATGMIGQGVLRECLLDGEVEEVLVVTRSPTGQQHEKLREIVHANLSDLSAVEPRLRGYDACFYCLGTSSAGMTEEAYRHVTYDLAMAAAEALVRQSPGMTFVFVSGTGADSTEKGRVMWARVKGMTENAVLRLPFKAVHVFRPAYIQPMHGIQAKGRLNRWSYALAGPLYPVWKTLFPAHVTTTEKVGRAMLAIARRGADKRVLENRDINAIVGDGAASPA